MYLKLRKTQLTMHGNCSRFNVHFAHFEYRFICEDHYGLFKAPEINLYGPRDLEFMYLPSHLHHMVFELLKNSLRAVVETHGIEADTYPPIRVIIAQGKEVMARLIPFTK